MPLARYRFCVELGAAPTTSARSVEFVSLMACAVAEPLNICVVEYGLPEPPLGAVDCQVVPLEVNTLPEVPGATAWKADVPLPSNTLFAAKVAAPEPPDATPNAVPRFNAPETPTPPVTTRVPDVVVVDAVPAVSVTAPLAVNVVNAPVEAVVDPTGVACSEPAYTAPETPIPPVITTVPVVVEVEAVPSVNVTALLAVNVVNAPVDGVVEPIGVPFNELIVNEPVVTEAELIAPETPRPPVTTKVPVVVDDDAVPSVKVTAPLAAKVVNEPPVPLAVIWMIAEPVFV